MRDPRLLLVVLLVLMVTPVIALPGPSPEEVEAYRRVVGKWRTDPEHYSRLKNDLKLFQALPPEHQDRMRQLDEDLHKKDPVERAELWRAMDRYVTWLNHLPPADRRRIDGAATSKAKLQIIQQLRDKEWLDRLPPGRGKEPCRLQEMRPEIQTYVRVVLMPALSRDELKQLNDADGKPWPAFARLVLSLSERHPPVFPGTASRTASWETDVPKSVKERLSHLMPSLSSADSRKVRMTPQDPGTWPDKGIAITEVLRKHGKMPEELGPCRPHEFHPFLRIPQYVERLNRVLDDKDRQRLHDAEGRWPDYPRALVELGNAHKMPVPGMKLPEPRGWSWDKVRGKN